MDVLFRFSSYLDTFCAHKQLVTSRQMPVTVDDDSVSKAVISADGSTGSRTDPTNSGDPKAKVAAAKAQIETCMGCPTRVQDCLHLTGIEH